MRKRSNPDIPDRARMGDDLLSRIEEMTYRTPNVEDDSGNGWRSLLLACASEIGRLRAELVGTADRIQRQEERRQRGLD